MDKTLVEVIREIESNPEYTEPEKAEKINGVFEVFSARYGIVRMVRDGETDFIEGYESILKGYKPQKGRLANPFSVPDDLLKILVNGELEVYIGFTLNGYPNYNSVVRVAFSNSLVYDFLKDVSGNSMEIAILYASAMSLTDCDVKKLKRNENIDRRKFFGKFRRFAFASFLAGIVTTPWPTFPHLLLSHTEQNAKYLDNIYKRYTKASSYQPKTL